MKISAIIIILLFFSGCRPKDSEAANAFFTKYIHTNNVNCRSIDVITPAQQKDNGNWTAKWQCNSVDPKIVWLSTDEYGRVDAQIESKTSQPAGRIILIED
jgi:hypothetical protein